MLCWCLFTCDSDVAEDEPWTVPWCDALVFSGGQPMDRSLAGIMGTRQPHAGQSKCSTAAGHI